MSFKTQSDFCRRVNNFTGLRMLYHDSDGVSVATPCETRLTPRDHDNPVFNCLVDYFGERAFVPRELNLRIGDTEFNVAEVLWSRSRTTQKGFWVSLQAVIRLSDSWEWKGDEFGSWAA